MRSSERNEVYHVCRVRPGTMGGAEASSTVSVPMVGNRRQRIERADAEYRVGLVFVCKLPVQPQKPADAGPRDALDRMLARWEHDPQRRAALERGRQWVANAVLAGMPETPQRLRLARGWSQARLAEEMGTTQARISRLERGLVEPDRVTLRQWARALGVGIEVLDQAIENQKDLDRQGNGQ